MKAISTGFPLFSHIESNIYRVSTLQSFGKQHLQGSHSSVIWKAISTGFPLFSHIESNIYRVPTLQSFGKQHLQGSHSLAMTIFLTFCNATSYLLYIVLIEDGVLYLVYTYTV